MIIGIFIGIAIAALLLTFGVKYCRRSQPFPEHWRNILYERLPIAQKLAEAQQQQLLQLTQDFIREKEFIGCAGLSVNEEMKVVIASQACLLLLNRPTTEYARLKTIYLYPTTFRRVEEVRDHVGLVSSEASDLLGESWSDGKVILAWDNVEHGVRNFSDGQNVVLHEFAHQLDQESGVGNGAPLLYTQAAYKSWAYVMGQEFEKLQQQKAKGEASIIDHYGATNPAEFFAVATETFFEEPEKMYLHHRQLYDELKSYYHQDPREWLS